MDYKLWKATVQILWKIVWLVILKYCKFEKYYLLEVAEWKPWVSDITSIFPTKNKLESNLLGSLKK